MRTNINLTLRSVPPIATYMYILNSFFQSTFTQERLDEIPVFPIRSPCGIGLADINVTEEIVLDRLSINLSLLKHLVQME